MKEADLARVARQIHAHRINCERKKFHLSKGKKTMVRTVDVQQEKQERTLDRENYVLISEVNEHLADIRLRELPGGGKADADSTNELRGFAAEFVAVPMPEGTHVSPEGAAPAARP